MPVPITMQVHFCNDSSTIYSLYITILTFFINIIIITIIIIIIIICVQEEKISQTISF